MPRSVDKVDLVFVAVIVPESGSGGRSDGDTTLLLLLHPVHGSGAVVNLTYFVSQTRIKQYALRCGGLTGIDMSHNTYITGKFK